MNIAELKEFIKNLPDDLEIEIRGSVNNEYEIRGPVNNEYIVNSDIGLDSNSTNLIIDI